MMLAKTRARLVAYVWFIATCAYQTLPSPGLLSSRVTTASGAVGDPSFNMWALRTSLSNLLDRPNRLLYANIFWPRTDGLAFSDSLIGYAPVYGAISALTGRNHTLAYNLLLWGMYALGAVFVYELCRFLDATSGPAVLGAVLFATLPYRSAEVVHLQLTGCWLVFAALIALMKWMETRRTRWILVSGALVGVCWYVSVYLVLVCAVTFVSVGVVWLVRRSRRSPVILRDAFSLAGAVFVFLAFLAPTISSYLRIQKGGWLARPVEQIVVIRHARLVPSTFYRAVAAQTGSPAGPDSLVPSPLGVLVIIAAIVLAIVAALTSKKKVEATGVSATAEVVAQGAQDAQESRQHSTGAQRASLAQNAADELNDRGRTFGVPLLVASIANALLAIGPRHGLLSTVFLAARNIGGFKSIREPSRFAVVPLALIAVFCADSFSRFLESHLVKGNGKGPAKGKTIPANSSKSSSGKPSRAISLVICTLSIILPLEALYRPANTAMTWPAPDEAVNTFLASRPGGVVVEEPMPTSTDQLDNVTGIRQVRSLIDGRPRIVGLSGGLPPEVTFPFHAARAFPAPEALQQLRALGVRYIVLHGVSGAAAPSPSAQQTTPCADVYSSSEIDEFVRNLPNAQDVERIDRAGSGAVVTLRSEPITGVDVARELPATVRNGPNCTTRVY
jgi:hypothetical protein